MMGPYLIYLFRFIMIKLVSSLLILAGVVAFSGCQPDPNHSYTLHSQSMPSGMVVPGARPVEVASNVAVAQPVATKPRANIKRIERSVLAREGQDIAVTVDVSEQNMRVSIDGQLAYQWPVSTAREGQYTPRGEYGVQWLSEFHKSSIYNDAPMPHSIFFNGNFAIHGTTDVKSIGSPASAGCVRLMPDDAAVLFQAVQAVGENNVSIVVRD